MKWATGICLLATAAFAGASQVASDPSKLPDYYPLTVGTRWTYELDQGTGPKLHVTSQIARIEMVDGKALAVQETELNGMIMATEHLSSTSKGVFRHRMNGIAMNPPACILKYPFKDGERWETPLAVGATRFSMAFESVRAEDVTTPSGKYKTVAVMGTATLDGTKTGSTCWYAPDVGIVKQKTEAGGKIITSELVKFVRAK
jgi:hypothetical protein